MKDINKSTIKKLETQYKSEKVLNRNFPKKLYKCPTSTYQRTVAKLH